MNKSPSYFFTIGVLLSLTYTNTVSGKPTLSTVEFTDVADVRWMYNSALTIEPNLTSLVVVKTPGNEKPVARWTFTTSPSNINDKLLESGDQIDLIFIATLDKDWLVYSSDFKADMGPQPTTFEFMPDDSFEFIGSVEPVSPRRKTDKTWETEISYFAPRAEFRQRIRILKPNYGARGIIRGQYCSEKKGLCIPFEQLFTFSVQ